MGEFGEGMSVPQLKYFACITLGVVFGFIFQNYAGSCGNSLHPTAYSRSEEYSSRDIASATSPDFEEESVRVYDTLDDLGSKEFSCNPRGAYEELTNLHYYRTKLEKHQKRGEANKARTATILRKVQQAEAAESAFRSCIQKTIPEVLKVWDGDLQKKSLRNAFLLYDKEQDKNGIDLKVLQDTAVMLDSLESA